MPSAFDILVIDDDRITRRVVRHFLMAAGYQVACVANGREALDLLHSGVRPSLILLDIHMPVLDGCDFRRIQKQDPKLAAIPVVLVSGESNIVGRAAALDAAANLEKPIRVEILLRNIRLLGQPQLFQFADK
jgi:CheY-like chemotaxis protein